MPLRRRRIIQNRLYGIMIVSTYPRVMNRVLRGIDSKMFGAFVTQQTSQTASTTPCALIDFRQSFSLSSIAA